MTAGPDWPESDKEYLGHCPVCRGTAAQVLYEGVRDRVFGVPRAGRFASARGTRSLSRSSANSQSRSGEPMKLTIPTTITLSLLPRRVPPLARPGGAAPRRPSRPGVREVCLARRVRWAGPRPWADIRGFGSRPMAAISAKLRHVQVRLYASARACLTWAAATAASCRWRKVSDMRRLVWSPILSPSEEGARSGQAHGTRLARSQYPPRRVI